MSFSLIYVATESKTSALAIGRILVQEKLVAYATIIPGATAIYHWHGQLEESDDIILLAQTTQANQELVIQRIEELHNYDSPCIISIPITSGSGDYLKWIENSVTLNNKVE